MATNRVIDAGRLFRKKRKSKGLSTKEISEGIVASSSVNKFEVGKIGLSFFNLSDLLVKMDISLDDFYQEVSDQNPSRYNVNSRYSHFLTEISSVYQTDDFATLEKIAVEEEQAYFHEKSLLNLAKAATVISLIKNFNSDYVYNNALQDDIEDYLMKTDNLNSFYLSVFNNTAALLTTPALISIYEDCLYQRPDDENVLAVMINLVDISYRRKDYQDAKKILGQLEKLISNNQNLLLARFKLTFFKNLLYHSREAAQRNQILIDALRYIGSNNIASSYSEYMKKYPFP
ncbi:Rgg/GadR/MutR family transcriptional regulator [Oenococcus kitaharae]|uniref:Rgg/GadR/MutR family transcriptional regulator n=1 Tax=Oenococcus TaxID=46254 RepID=UPI0021E773DC|nr:Rgg/GadR/MutR family transcriptional regulator [Oenococcus kitaharae]MCV3296729.1 Rgg/GadR/MutR family transcriptional regulator [Oenococcus kitaharae]